jgi:uncharacterized membrane protein
MPLRNAHAQSQLKLADALGFSGGLQSLAKAWAGRFHCVIESHRTALSITCDVIALIQGAANTVDTLKENPVKKPLLILALIALGAATTIALWQDGLVGISAAIVHSYGSMQIFSDLVIALTLVMLWMWRDAKSSGRNIWPWIVVTLVAGSFGPLLYLISGKEKS